MKSDALTFLGVSRAAVFLAALLLSPVPVFALTVIYAPTLPEGSPVAPTAAAENFAGGLGVEGDWYYNTPSLFGDVRTALRSPKTLSELIVYAAQSEADDTVCLRLAETPEGWFGYALRWNHGTVSGACRGARDPVNFDWWLLGEDLARGRSPVPGNGEPDSLPGVRWFGHALDEGLALVASARWLEHRPEEVTAALQLADRAGQVVRQIAVVGDVPAVNRLLDGIAVLVGVAGEAADRVSSGGEGQNVIITLYFAGHAAENAWRVTRYAGPYQGIGDLPEETEAAAGRVALESERYWEKAVEGYRRAVDSAGIAELGGSWVLMSRVALMLLYHEAGREEE
ncbi:MAG: hypothetical protein A2Y64_06130 [Candidatus Coatesbacteria bacterium RBG_13_66_14]|uniref:Uncharacterized protein n=1 Tax=Candidatus Coatesbacteria bacterium RBG_13_66_14 TaxID=1817816 RepID=A0A1F5EXT2_9BACT|nr:MAG: hypothetical protein A2Y64_06130 [Candidatus Coatesbacteria bacterium RBG_13_66_14]